MKETRLKVLQMAMMGLLACSLPFSAPEAQSQDTAKEVISLSTMGNFFFGGTVSRNSQGDTFHGDHGYAQYYVASHSRTLPIVMWHGIGQSGRSFESTPDGREGFQALLPRRDWSVYIVDQPRRGRAGRTQAKYSGAEIPTTASEAGVWNAFRNGVWELPGKPGLWTDTQFPTSGSSINQFFRQQTPSTSDEPSTAEFRLWMGETFAKLFDQIGDGILLTHSNSGQYGWETAMSSDHVKAIVAFEPGGCAFPNEEPPSAVAIGNSLAGERLEPRMVPMSRWNKLTKIPIVIIFGDHIADQSSHIFNVDVWRIARERARQFVDLINHHGGDATLIELPKLGIHGNTHAAFSDRNNLQVLDIVSDWLHSKKLDGYEKPHTGPAMIEMKSVIETIPMQD